MVQRPRQESAQPTLHVLINWFATLSHPERRRESRP